MIFRLFTMIKLQLHNRILPRHSYMLTNTNYNYALAVLKKKIQWNVALFWLLLACRLVLKPKFSSSVRIV